MKVKLQFFTAVASLTLLGNVMAQSITVPTEVVIKGGTAVVNLSFVEGGATTNLDFTMTYDETVVDEASASVACDPAVIGLTFLTCSVDTTTNTVKGIGGNFSGLALTSGAFAAVTLPTLAGAATGDSTNPFTGNFSASGTVTPLDTTWTLTITDGPQPAFGSTPDAAAGVSLSGETGTTIQTSVVINNDGGDDGSTLNYTCSETADGDNKFTIGGDTTNFDVPKGSTGTVTVACDSSAIGGPFSGEMQCTHNASGSPAIFALSCSVSAGPPGMYASSPVSSGGTINMTPPGDPVPENTPVADSVLTISNAAAVGANTSDVVLSNCGFAGSTQITATAPGSLTLAPQASTTVTFSCDSAAAGAYTGTYSCDYDETDDGTIEGTATYTVNCGVRTAESDITESPTSGTAVGIVVMQNGTGQNSVSFTESLDEGVDASVDTCSIDDGNFAVVTSLPATVTAGSTFDVMFSGTDPVDGSTSISATLTCTYTDSDSDPGTASWPVTLTIQTAAIPTLSSWGLMLMILTIMGLGGIVIRRKTLS